MRGISPEPASFAQVSSRPNGNFNQRIRRVALLVVCVCGGGGGSGRLGGGFDMRTDCLNHCHAE